MKLQALIQTKNHPIDYMRNKTILGWEIKEGTKLFQQDDDVPQKIPLKVAEFYGKLNPTAFLIGLCQ